jgi:hypothetical protein
MAVDEFSDYPDTGASGSQEYTSPQDPSIEFTTKNPRGDYDPPQPNADYGVGATGNVSSAGRQTSGGGSGIAPFIHPFKLERVLDPDDPNSTKVRVYEGDVYAKIDTFQLEIVSITTGASHTHSAGDYNIPDHQHHQGGTASSGSDTGNTGTGTAHSHGSGNYEIPNHTHKASEGSDALSIPQHTHEAGTLKAADHTHMIAISTNTGAISSGSTGCYDAGHYHSIAISQNTGSISVGSSVDVSGDTANVNTPSSSSLHVTGNTGGLSTSTSTAVTGTSGDESSHTHSYNKNDHTHTLSGETGNIYGSSSTAVTGNSGTNSNSAETKKFVAITGQSEAPLLTNTTWAGVFNKTVVLDDGTNSSFSYHETAHSDGDFYVKWVITISEAAAVQSVVGSIERVAVGAGAPADVSFGDLNQDPDVNSRKLSRTDPTFNGSNDTTKLVGTFHQKIGSVSTTTVDQVQFSNINWSMTVLPEVS